MCCPSLAGIGAFAVWAPFRGHLLLCPGDEIVVVHGLVGLFCSAGVTGVSVLLEACCLDQRGGATMSRSY